MSIRIVRGTRAALRRHFAGLSAGTPLRLAQPTGRFHGFGATRRLLADARALVGAAAYEATLARHAPAAALLLPGRSARLGDDARRARDAFAARVTSHLTHNFIVQAPLFDAWAALLDDLLAQAGRQARVVLLVPDLAATGWEDAALLRALYRRGAGRLPELRLGFDAAAAEVRGEDGIVWSMTSWKTAGVALDLHALQAEPPLWLRDDDAGDTAPAGDEQPAPTWVDPDDLEAQARAALQASPARPSRPVARLVYGALDAAFSAFAFTSVLEVGLELLRRDAPLEPLERADVHAWVALAAHDRQFVSDGNDALAMLIERHVEAALASETRPERRAALCYRLAVVHGRRRRDAQPALAVTERALDACRDPRLLPLEAAYQEAWARNIRALALVHARRLDEARAETTRGFELIDAAVADLPDPRGRAVTPFERDLRASHSLLAFNTRTLLEWLGADASQSAAWLAVSQAAVRALPGMERFEALHWADHHRRAGRPDLARDLARRGARAARDAGDALRAYQHGLLAAEISALLGDAGDACAQADELHDLRARCGLPRLAGLDALVGLACARASRTEEAQRRLTSALDASAPDAPGRAGLVARLALAVADGGDEPRALALFEQAFALARAEGERDTLLRVTVAAGRHLARRGRRDEARDAFEQALAIAEVGAAQAPPPPGELLGALLGLVACGGDGDGTRLERARACAASALDDADVAADVEILLALHAARAPAAADDAETSAQLAALRRLADLRRAAGAA